MMNNSFEIYTLKDKQWQINCIFDAKSDASDEAARMVQAGHYEGVKVVEEKYDEHHNKAKAIVVTEWIKGQESAKPYRRYQGAGKKDSTQARRSTAALPRKKKTKSFLNQLIISIIAIFLILLGIVFGGFFLVDRF